MLCCLATLAGCDESNKQASNQQPEQEAMAEPTGDVMITVGDKKYTREEIEPYLEARLKRIPPAQRARPRKRLIDRIIEDELVRAYLKKVPVSKEELVLFKQEFGKQLAIKGQTFDQFVEDNKVSDEALRLMAADAKLKSDATKLEKLAVFIRANPSYFDGTKVRASHILVNCNFYASPVEVEAALAKLAAVAEKISAGKIDFAEAAVQHSQGPSKDRGGDLGEFTFGSMVPPFAIAAFATEVGQVTDIIRSNFGFHLIKVTGKTPGSGQRSPQAMQVAQKILLAGLKDKMVAESLKTNPVTVAD